MLLFALLSVSLHATAWLTIEHGAKRPVAPFFAAPAQPLAGDTLDIDPSLTPLGGESAEPPWTSPTPTPTPTLPSRGGSSLTPRARPPTPPAVFGAVGVPFATDLATTFTRVFPQAASAYPAWSSVPFGDAGRAVMKLVLDEEGHLASHEIAGSPSSALRRSVELTLVLLAPRSFTARAAGTKLSVTAHVSRDDVHDGLHGDVFALSAGSFAGEIGTAFFALPPAAGPGRRVDVEVKLLP